MGRLLHLMAVDILDARARSTPLPHRRAGYTDEQLKRLYDTLDFDTTKPARAKIKTDDNDRMLDEALAFEHDNNYDGDEEAAIAFGHNSHGIDSFDAVDM